MAHLCHQRSCSLIREMKLSVQCSSFKPRLIPCGILPTCRIQMILISEGQARISRAKVIKLDVQKEELLDFHSWQISPGVKAGEQHPGQPPACLPAAGVEKHQGARSCVWEGRGPRDRPCSSNLSNSRIPYCLANHSNLHVKLIVNTYWLLVVRIRGRGLVSCRVFIIIGITAWVPVLCWERQLSRPNFTGFWRQRDLESAASYRVKHCRQNCWPFFEEHFLMPIGFLLNLYAAK